MREAAKDHSRSATAVLLDTIDTDDDTARLEAIDALVERKHIAALPRLIKLDPASDPFLGPTIIGALGELGAAAGPRDRGAALARLVSLLADEKERRGTDSSGNVLAIIEALGVLRQPEAATILERELFDPFHDTAARTTIVNALRNIGQRSSLEPLARLRALVVERPPTATDDDFARALDRELAEAIDATTSTLTRK